MTPRETPPTVQTDNYGVPALIGNLGEAAAWRYVEFFTANIRNPNTTPGKRLQRRLRRSTSLQGFAYSDTSKKGSKIRIISISAMTATTTQVASTLFSSIQPNHFSSFSRMGGNPRRLLRDRISQMTLNIDCTVFFDLGKAWAFS
jgi:hypothetical protein